MFAARWESSYFWHDNLFSTKGAENWQLTKCIGDRVYSPPMHAAVAILSVLFNNGLVIWGLGWAGWSGPTALAIYWGENAIGTIFIALRIWLHRRLTGKRGHYRNHFGQTSGGFLTDYLTTSVVFTLATLGAAVSS